MHGMFHYALLYKFLESNFHKLLLRGNKLNVGEVILSTQMLSDQRSSLLWSSTV